MNSSQGSFFESLAGGRKGVPSLTSICCDVLRENLDLLPPLAHVPKPVYEGILAKCSAEKLSELEKYNKVCLTILFNIQQEGDVDLDTNDLWKELFKARFTRNTDQFESQLDQTKKRPWKDLYMVIVHITSNK